MAALLELEVIGMVGKLEDHDQSVKSGGLEEKKEKKKRKERKSSRSECEEHQVRIALGS